MAYFGKILDDDLIEGKKVVEILKNSLAELYQQNRFLGPFQTQVGNYIYQDSNFGDLKHFHGVEKILVNQKIAYELRYFGGLVRK